MNEDIQGYRLSPQQRRAWSLGIGDRRSSGRAGCAILLEGTLDAERLGAALRDVVQRHDILRTAFRRLPGMTHPLQVIGSTPAFDLTVQRLDAAQAEQATSARALDAAWSGEVELDRAPLSATLHELAPDRHLVTVTLSSLCADAVSLETFARALAQAYAGEGAAGDAGDDGPLQYVVVSDWLNETLDADTAEVGKQFWRNQLPRGAAASMERVPAAALAGEAVSFALGASTRASLAQSAARQGATPASVLTAAWQVLMWRLRGDAALPIAAVLDGRSATELAEAIGPLARHLPVVSSIEADAPFSQVVARVEAALAEAAAWQECYDGDALLRVDAETAGFLPYAFEYRAGHQVHTAGDVTLRVIRCTATADRYALLLTCLDGASGLDAELRYDADRFTADEARRIAERFQVLVASVLENVDAPVGALDVLPEAERRTLLVDLNDTGVDIGAPRVIHRRIEAQAARTPDRIAVAFEGATLTYRQLDARANQLARALQRQGVGRNVAVGLLMERSLEMVVGILGILKAGGAYIPLDAEYPEDRLSYMVADSRAPVLVTQESVTRELASIPAAVVRIGGDWSAIAGEDDGSLDTSNDPEDLAYVLYTSGSTGRPKGVMIPHRALCNHMHWMQARFPIGEDDSVLQKTPFSFDASVWEFYAPLLVGARLVMAQPGGHRDTFYLQETLVRERITTLQLVPTLLRMLMDEPGFERCTSLRRVYCGGEALSADLRDRFFALSAAELVNLYGPTEVTIDATYHVCRRDVREPSVPIGRPVANTQIYLLDERRQPVPLGVAGELYLGGDSVGLGYLHNPGLSAERFLADPFRAAPGARLYRTGDVGRYRADGSLEYLGRIDNQIKLRGHRIELGEIEASLARQAQIHECVVVVREDVPGDRRLAAYFVPRAGAAPRPSELRAFLKDQLPDYMVPAAFCKLDGLPLLPNGKIDQRGLPVPDDNHADVADRFVAPRNAIEEEVARIWAEVLNVQRIGIHDDFFELGGHSLIATQLTSRIRKMFHVDVPLRELFAAPTVLGLVEQITRLQSQLAEQGEVDEVLAELEGLSDEEVKALLESEPGRKRA